MPFDKRSEGMESAADILARMETAFEQKAIEQKATPATTTPAKRAELLLETEIIRPEDIAYVHSIFLQCFLPVRHNANNKQRWQVDHGRASLVIRAGELVNPTKPNEFEPREVPAGPKARFVVAYIHDYIRRKKTRCVDLGDSLRDSMEKFGVKIGGENGKALAREIKNFAAAEISMGLWFPDGSARQPKALVSEDVLFWIDKDERQRTLWQKHMMASQKYYDIVMGSEHMAPVYMPAMVRLEAKGARAQDIHAFLTYRLRNGLRKPATIPAHALHALFGRGIKQFDHFWTEFVTALKAAHVEYPQARIEIMKDRGGIRLYDSPPLIPHRKLGWIE